MSNKRRWAGHFFVFVILALSLILGGGNLSYAGSTLQKKPETFEQFLQKGQEALQAKKYGDARREIDTAFAQGITYANAYVIRGDLKLVDRKYVTAVEDYEKAMQVAAPQDEGLARLRELTAALKSYLEFQKHKGDPGYQRAILLNRAMPHYTEEARRQKVQGKVELAVLISERGDVSSVLIFSRLGYGLDQEAIKAARRLKFSPASKDGTPVPYWSKVVVEFNIR